MWTVCVPGWGACMVAGALLLYSSLDVAYFARMMYTVAKARYFGKKSCILDTTEVHCKYLVRTYYLFRTQPIYYSQLF